MSPGSNMIHCCLFVQIKMSNYTDIYTINIISFKHTFTVNLTLIKEINLAIQYYIKSKYKLQLAFDPSKISLKSIDKF